MGYRHNATVNINPDAIRQALSDADYTLSAASRIIGGADNYLNAAVRRGSMDADKLNRLAHLCRVDVKTLLKADDAPAEEKADNPEVGGQTIARIYDQLVRQNQRLEDMEKHLRRLQSVELRQEKMVNQQAALVDLLTRWSDQITKLTNQATGCNTNLLRLLALFERMKKG